MKTESKQKKNPLCVPTLEIERVSGFPTAGVLGLDEVGRGCIAGPVTAAAVKIPDLWNETLPSWASEVRDSKLLDEKVRERLAVEIREAMPFAIAHASVEEIDRINILRASHLAMERAVESLTSRGVGFSHVLVDGNLIPRGLLSRPFGVSAHVKGDQKSLAIACASILAKVERDGLLRALEFEYPGYGFATHKGYPTPFHQAALLSLGTTPSHRKSFGPVRALLSKVAHEQTHASIRDESGAQKTLF